MANENWPFLNKGLKMSVLGVQIYTTGLIPNTNGIGLLSSQKSTTGQIHIKNNGAVATTNTITVTFSADPGATTVLGYWAFY